MKQDTSEKGMQHFRCARRLIDIDKIDTNKMKKIIQHSPWIVYISEGGFR